MVKKEKLRVIIEWDEEGSIFINPSNQEAMKKYIGQISDLAFKLLDDFMKDMARKGKKLEKLNRNKKRFKK